ncbi:hypothetical protein EON82_08005 [bacterium]|nr:MAG: hypothetical protein EON82_08005 [bacterium]
MNSTFPPGVRYERVDVGPPSVPSLRTDVAGFVGLAERGPVDVPVPVESFRQFQAVFGGFLETAYLAYSVRAFFENGGQRCYVVRVASGAGPAFVSLGPVRILASSPGTWGNRLRVEAREIHRAQTTISSSDGVSSWVASVAGLERGSLVRVAQGTTELWRVVALIEPISGRVFWEEPLFGIDPAAPAQLESYEISLLVWQEGRLRVTYETLSLVAGPRRFVADVLGRSNIEPIMVFVEGDPGPLSSLGGRLTGGSDGLGGLTPYDYIGESVSPLDDDLTRARKWRGLRTLEAVSEVSILAVPDIHIQPELPPVYAPLPPCPFEPCRGETEESVEPPAFDAELPPRFEDTQVYQVQAAMIEQCERLHDRFAVLSAPFSAVKDPRQGLAGIQQWRSRFETKYGALYYPWAVVTEPRRDAGDVTRTVPPCGHVVGQYAATDRDIGVHKAPANAPLGWIQDLTELVGSEQHALLNGLAINVLFAPQGRGMRIGGARTLSSDTDWRFVNVRRLMCNIEKAIEVALNWAVFEPNDGLTQAKIRLSLFSYLLGLFQSGALAGATADAAFFVRCDETNNPPEVRDRGWLIAEIGVAPAQPFEYIVVRIGRLGNAFEVQREVF